MRTKIIIVLIIIIALSTSGAALYLFMNRQTKPTIRTATVKRQDVVQDVAFTGRLQSEKISHLSFESTGTIANLYVKQGDSVTSGQALAKVEEASADLNLAKAQADLSAAQEQKKIGRDKANQKWEDTRVTNARTLEKYRQAVRDKKTELDQYRAIHQQVAREEGADSSTLETAVANLRLAETSYHTAQQALLEITKSAKQTEDAARRAADLAKAQYRATLQASGEVAGLSSLKALEAQARHTVAKKTIVAPFDGVITSVDKEKGETTTTGETVITIETTNNLELKASVTETDAAKLAVDMKSTITFDALPPQEQWTATITEISPAAKIIEGVPTYKITLRLNSIDPRFKPGLTANVTVHANIVEKTLAIPRRAVATHGETQYVRVLAEDGSISEHKITTGLVGSTGTIEVTSGISEGQQVVTDTKLD